MSETERIAVQLENSIAGPAWYGPALLEALGGVTSADASRRPIPGWKSIWELVLHVIAWQRVALRRLGGDKAELEIGGPEDWPTPPAPGDRAWEDAIARVRAANAELAAAVRALPAERLEQPIVPGYSTCYHHLQGVAQHNAYHAGQIVALKRALGLPAVLPRQT